MYQSLVNLSSDIKQLLDEGYCLEVRGSGGFLVIHRIPYVNSKREIKYGTLVSELIMSGKDKTTTPSTHQIYFKGDYPCAPDGTQLPGLGGRAKGSYQLFEGFTADYYFSCKPHGRNGYDNYYEKVSNYASIISAQAKSLDETVTEKSFRPIFHEEESVFEYYDLNSSKANILTIADKLKNLKVAIVGVGGTGSYILDFISKTPLNEIHVFDGDDLFVHNAFRAPGAVPLEELDENLKKAVYFHRIYSKMHKKITPHPIYLSESSFHLLSEMSFVFIAIDKGVIKEKLFEYLISKGISFIDVGMSMEKTQNNQLTGHLRVTTGTPEFNSHLKRRITLDDPANNIYNSNIQIAEVNALNAALAVIKFKKLFGFYLDLENEHHLDFTIEFSQLLNNEIPT
jgi:hypothetical protein